jgi:hypothetical protein
MARFDESRKGATSILQSVIGVSPRRLATRDAKTGIFLSLLGFLRILDGGDVLVDQREEDRETVLWRRPRPDCEVRRGRPWGL